MDRYGVAKRILIVEDEKGLVLALEDCLKSEGYDTSSVGNGIAGQIEAQSGIYDLVVLDVMLPGRDGFQVCRNLREAGCRTPVLMLTARSSTIDTVMGLRLGADDYLSKPFDTQVLLARVHALLRRSEAGLAGGNGGARSHRFGRFELDMETMELRREGELIALTAQELRLLSFLAEHPNRVLKRDEILDQAWGYDSETTTRTVDVHVSLLRQKLGGEEGARHLVTVRGLGYRFVPDP